MLSDTTPSSTIAPSVGSNMTATRNNPLQMTSQEKPSPKLGHSEPMVSRSAPVSHLRQPEAPKPTPNVSTGYMSPLQPQNAAATSPAGMGWSSSSATTGITPRSSSGSPSLFSGMRMNAQAPIQPTNVQASTSSGPSLLMPTQQQNGTGSSWSANIQPQSSQPLMPTPAQSSQPLMPTPAQSSQPLMPTPVNGTGSSWSANIQPQSSQPLMPTPVQWQSGTGSSWSANIQPQSSQPLMQTSVQQQVGTGSSWSTNMHPAASQQGNHMGQHHSQMGGWSSNIASSRPGVGSSQSHGGMSWSANIQGGMASGMGMQSQPTAASVLMGGGQPLIPQNSTRMQQQPFQQQQQQQQQQFAATGANPFADLSFLS